LSRRLCCGRRAGGIRRHDRGARRLGLSGHGESDPDRLLRGRGDRRHRLHQGCVPRFALDRSRRHLRPGAGAGNSGHDGLHAHGGRAAVAAGGIVRSRLMTASPPLLLRTLLVVGLAGLALYPLVGDVFYLQLFAKIMIFAVFAMSLDLLVGFTGLISLGHAAFFGLGAYALMLLTPEYAAASLWVSLAVAVGAAALAGIVIGALVIRTSGVYFIMVTLAFAQMLYYFAIKSKALGGSDGAYIYVKPEASILGWRPFDLGNRVHFYYVALAVMVACYVLLATVLRSLFGRVIQGLRANEPRMRALGYPVFRYKLPAFALAAALPGLAGYLQGGADG